MIPIFFLFVLNSLGITYEAPFKKLSADVVRDGAKLNIEIKLRIKSMI